MKSPIKGMVKVSKLIILIIGKDKKMGNTILGHHPIFMRSSTTPSKPNIVITNNMCISTPVIWKLEMSKPSLLSNLVCKGIRELTRIELKNTTKV